MTKQVEQLTLRVGFSVFPCWIHNDLRHHGLLSVWLEKDRWVCRTTEVEESLQAVVAQPEREMLDIAFLSQY